MLSAGADGRQTKRPVPGATPYHGLLDLNPHEIDKGLAVMLRSHGIVVHSP